jgi:hypothetical protein
MSTAMSEVATETLTVDESGRLVELERTIEHGLATVIEVGEALMEICDSRLYRGEQRTFEDYCRKEWKMSRPRVYQLIGAAGVATRLSTTVDKPEAADTPAHKIVRALRCRDPHSRNGLSVRCHSLRRQIRKRQ